MKRIHITDEELNKFAWYLRLYGIDDMLEMMRRDAYDKDKRR